MSEEQANTGSDQNDEEPLTKNEKLVASLKAVKIGNQSVRSTALASGLARTTLQRCITQFDKTGNEITKMTDAQLLTFVENKPKHGSHRMVKLNLQKN